MTETLLPAIHPRDRLSIVFADRDPTGPGPSGAPSDRVLGLLLQRGKTLEVQVFNAPPLAELHQGVLARFAPGRPDDGAVGLWREESGRLVPARNYGGAPVTDLPWNQAIADGEWLARLTHVRRWSRKPWRKPARWMRLPLLRAWMARWRHYAFHELREPFEGCFDSEPYDESFVSKVFGSKLDQGLSSDESRWALRLPPGGRVLVIGCAGGRQVRGLAMAGFRAYGVDLSPTMVKGNQGDEILTIGDGRCLPYRDSSFDGVLLGLLLPSIMSEPSAMVALLREASRVLAPGGSLASDYRHVNSRERSLAILIGPLHAGCLGSKRPAGIRPAYRMTQSARLMYQDQRFLNPTAWREMLDKGWEEPEFPRAGWVIVGRAGPKKATEEVRPPPASIPDQR